MAREDTHLRATMQAFVKGNDTQTLQNTIACCQVAKFRECKQAVEHDTRILNVIWLLMERCVRPKNQFRGRTHPTQTANVDFRDTDEIKDNGFDWTWHFLDTNRVLREGLLDRCRQEGRMQYLAHEKTSLSASSESGIS